MGIKKQNNDFLDDILPDIALENNIDANDLYRIFDMEEWLSLLADAAEEHFTDDELDAMIAFYSTPIGRSILEKMSGLMENLGTYSINFVGQKLDEFFAQKDAAYGSNNSGNSSPN